MNNRNISYFVLLCLGILFLFPLQAKSETFKVRTIVNDAKIRLKPNSNSTIINTVNLGVVLEADRTEGEWVRVNLPPDEKGFVVSGYILSINVEIFEDMPLKEEKKIIPVIEKSSSLADKSFQVYKKSGLELSVKISGGWSYIIGHTPINDHLNSFNNIWNAKLASPNLTLNSEFQPVKMGPVGSAEILLYFVPQFGIGIGLGYIQQQRTSIFNMSNEGENWTSLVNTVTPKISAIPLTMNLFLGLPFGDKTKINIYAGAGYYLGEVGWDYEERITHAQIEDEYDITEWSAKSNALGFQAGLNIEIGLNKFLDIVFDVTSSFAQFSDLTGISNWRAKWEGGNPVENTRQNITLWDGEKWNFQTQQSHDWILLYNLKPDWGNFRNFEKAKIALNNVALKLGFKLKLFGR